MGRGLSWTDGEIEIVKTYKMNGHGPAYVHGENPSWPLSSIKKLMARDEVLLHTFMVACKTEQQ